MSDLISRESLKQRINLNYNNHQYIDIQSIKDIINTEPSVEDKTIEELKKIKAEIEDEEYSTNWLVSAEVEKGWNEAVEYAIGKIDNHIEKLKGEVE